MATLHAIDDPGNGLRTEKNGTGEPGDIAENVPPWFMDPYPEYEMDEDDVLEGRLPEAFDDDGDPVVYSLFDGPDVGVATVHPDGRFSYAPPENFSGTNATFYVHASDGRGGIANAMVRVMVNNVNDEPVVVGGVPGNPVVGETLRGGLQVTDADGIDWMNAVYRWEYANPALLNWQVVPGSTAANVLVVTESLVGSVIRYGVEYTDMKGTLEFAATPPTAPVTAAGPPNVLTGGEGHDAIVDHSTGGSELWGMGGNDTLTGGAGNDTLVGGPGIDVAVYAGNRSNYALTLNTSQQIADVVMALSGVEGTDNLAGVERLWFADGKLAIDFGYTGHAEITAKILGAVFGPAAIGNAGYAGIGLSLLDAGFDDAGLMRLALDARLGAGFSNEQMVTVLLGNLGITPDPGSVALYSGLIADGSFTQVSLAIVAADHPLNAAGIGLAGLQQSGLAYL